MENLDRKAQSRTSSGGSRSPTNSMTGAAATTFYQCLKLVDSLNFELYTKSGCKRLVRSGFYDRLIFRDKYSRYLQISLCDYVELDY